MNIFAQCLKSLHDVGLGGSYIRLLKTNEDFEEMGEMEAM